MLVTRPPIHHDNDVDNDWLCDDPLLLALPADHPADTPTTVSLDHLDDTPLIIHEPAEAPGPHTTVNVLCEGRIFTPTRVHTSPDIASLLILVGAGLGCGFIPRSAARHHHNPAIRIVPPPRTLPDHPTPRRLATQRPRPALADLRIALRKAAT